MDTTSNPYLRSAVMTAPPEQLLLMLYDGAIRFTRKGIEGLRARDWEAAFDGLSRAQKIILELVNSLNYDVDRELCTRVAGLYNFIYRKLVEAGSGRDEATAAEALRLLEYQRETWVMLINKLNREQGDAGAAGPGPEPDTPAEASYGAFSIEG